MPVICYSFPRPATKLNQFQSKLGLSWIWLSKQKSVSRPDPFEASNPRLNVLPLKQGGGESDQMHRASGIYRAVQFVNPMW